MTRTKRFSEIKIGQRFSYKKALYKKVDPEYTPNGRSNAKDEMDDTYITIRGNSKVTLITTRFDYA